MPYPANPATTPEARIRAYYALSQAQLGRYLGVSAAFVGHLEAGRKALPVALTARLLHLAQGLPARWPGLPAPGPPAALPPLLSAAPEAVRRRHRDLVLLAHGLGQRQARLQAQAAARLARRHGLSRLAALPPPAAPPEAARWAAWLRGVADDVDAADTAAATDAPARLLAARLVGVWAEIGALAG